MSVNAETVQAMLSRPQEQDPAVRGLAAVYDAWAYGGTHVRVPEETIKQYLNSMAGADRVDSAMEREEDGRIVRQDGRVVIDVTKLVVPGTGLYGPAENYREKLGLPPRTQ